MHVRSVVSLLFFAGAASVQAQDTEGTRLEAQFREKIQPFLETHCYECHGKEKPEAELNLTAFTSLGSLLREGQRWGQMLERLEAEEMPPSDATKIPTAEARRETVAWFRAVRAHEIAQHAGDPGLVLARRLSHGEYNYSIRDLTGVDLRPTREFPVDPANTAGFDNSGETLVMSPTLLKKYLGAAREVANHLFLRENGLAFAPHPMVAEADREKFCVTQIIDLYHRQVIDYAEYFAAAWRYRHRAALGRPQQTLAECAREQGVSPKYLATIWSTLEEPVAVGPLAKLQAQWRALPASAEAARTGCEAMRDYVVGVRRKVERRFLNINAGEVNTAWIPFLHWKNEQYARNRRTFDPTQLQVEDEPELRYDGFAAVEWDNAFGPGKTPFHEHERGDPDLTLPAGQRATYEAAWAKFASVFPDMFYREERGRFYFKTGKDEGRYLSAGYHNVMGYFRDDWPLYELVLERDEQVTLDRMWRELDFIASAQARSYVQFAINGTRGARESFDDREPALTLVAQLKDSEIASTPAIRQLEAGYLARVINDDPVTFQALRDYFRLTDEGIRATEKARRDAEPGHIQALLDLAARAYRRPLTKEERDDLLEFYRTGRNRDGLDHETALRETLVLILMAPEFTYRIDLAGPGNGVHPLSNYDVASRLSYFLWSSVPDAELIAQATAGKLHDPAVLKAQARRMLRDPRARALAVEFGGNWLDFRRFEDIATVDRDRFPAFTTDLKLAMFEEPVRFLLEVFQGREPVLDLLYANHTFVNAPLAKHYGMPYATPVPATRGAPVPNEGWVRADDAGRYGRGGLLPMAAFLTKNAPGLRTSPVKRGNWLVKNVLGERIPAPPPNVPELPKDEAHLDLPLRDVLARHRTDRNCAACHERFDSLGLVFEGYGPIGERRENDLGGRPIEARATFPGGFEGEGLDGVRKYIHERRQKDFVHNLTTKLLAYALGRSLMLTDEPLQEALQRDLAAGGYRFDTLVEGIVTSRQFLNRRGRETVSASESP
jgi:hypothetical protein